MTDAGWAEKAVNKVMERLDCFCQTCASPGCQKLLQAEHARSVRIARRLGKRDVLKQFDHKTYEYAEGYLQACKDFEAALQRGRGGKGK